MVEHIIKACFTVLLYWDCKCFTIVLISAARGRRAGVIAAITCPISRDVGRHERRRNQSREQL